MATETGIVKWFNDGKGFVFVSHIGNIQPSGFLPLTAGNVRKDELLEVYRHSPLFQSLRDSSLLKGKCGRCEFKNICGGSRARTYAMTGDHLGIGTLLRRSITSDARRSRLSIPTFGRNSGPSKRLPRVRHHHLPVKISNVLVMMRAPGESGR